ncbi:MAG: LAGLIDADG family homing endonuclease [Candidatus Omnitrophota bacterium]|nr:LAGLIDADG family homing endonuclease [Candidatus Omnitrophota bacterium]
MVKLELCRRTQDIESRFNARVEDLLYQMHWPEEMKHSDISAEIDIPRATVTKWFHHYDIPTQTCRRFTDMNLTSWLYKTGQLKKKPEYKKPVKEPQANVNFFKKWSTEMAYVLGYFAADGSMYANPRGAKYITFSSIDREMLEKVKRCLNSKHKIALRKRYNDNWQDSYTFQIGSKEMYSDMIKLGFMQNKARRFHLPKVPKKYMNHFIRGHFDGDGSISCGYTKIKARNYKMVPYVSSCFASANLSFLREIYKVLKENAGLAGGHIDKKGGHLAYSKSDSIKLFYYMYRNATKDQYLERKYTKFLQAVNPEGGSLAN